jgi:ABC-type uncharacterized transport system ATPase component
MQATIFIVNYVHFLVNVKVVFSTCGRYNEQTLFNIDIEIIKQAHQIICGKNGLGYFVI